MPIRFKPNDPRADAPDRIIHPSPGRSGGSIGFLLPPPPGEAEYPDDGAGFTHWQVREAALRTLTAWDEMAAPLGHWQHGQRRLSLLPDAGIGLQGTYDREALRFYRWEHPQPFYVGSSVDAVAHEVGHALLDALRPDLWQSPYPEIVAFHEAFADCIALLSALLDPLQSAALLATDSPDPLTESNDISRIAESVAAAYALSFPVENASATARDANNTLAWDFPHTLAPTASGAGLSSEPHSFSRIFTGCIYDCVRRIFSLGAAETGQLQQAARVTGTLLVDAVNNAPAGIEFFRTVGRAMVLADRERHAGAHQHCISAAFGDHGIVLGSSSLVAPVAALAGSGQRGGSTNLMPEARQDLCRRLGLGQRARFRYRRIRLAGRRLLDATHQVTIDAGRYHRQLKNVKLRAPVSVLVDTLRARQRIVHTLPDRALTEEHVSCFVLSLLQNRLLIRGGTVLTADGPAGSGPTGSGPTGSGPTGSGPAGSGPAGSGPAGSGPAGDKGESDRDRAARPAFSIRKQHGELLITRIRCACQVR